MAYKAEASSIADEKIKGAHFLNGNVTALTSYYDTWAPNYDVDAAAEGYRGPNVLADLSAACHSAYLHGPRSEVKILDAGCGTGLVGVELLQRGFETVDGVDLSPKMVQLAAGTGAYRNLYANVDLGLPPPIEGGPPDRYDLLVSCGVFLHGHLAPEALWALKGSVRAGGYLLAVTRESYLGATNFGQVVSDLVAAGEVSCQLRLQHAAYIDEEPATYWALRVLNDRPGTLRV